MENKNFLETVHVSDLPKVSIVHVNSDVTAVEALKVRKNETRSVYNSHSICANRLLRNSRF